VDAKIKALDKELVGFKEQLKKAKGPTANHIKKRAMATLQRKVCILDKLSKYSLLFLLSSIDLLYF
jgi:hypothetical protein